MISNLALDHCTLERKEDLTYLVTPDKTINCELPVPAELVDQFEDRYLMDSEIAVIQCIRDSGKYMSFDEPFQEAPNFSVGKMIALFVARFNNCITVNEEDGMTVPIEYRWSCNSNGHSRVKLGGIYDLVSKYGTATVMVISKLEDEDPLHRSETVKCFVLSDVYFPVCGTDRHIRQLSKVNVDSRYLVDKGAFRYS
ncbi:hypothetical protein [Vibrio penaeicida]|uniref:Uncharacterized protein n=1 Tax=Vibrio penaeicida TaxID=104609 RepID=A0AAV5NKW1_9VIBR|nr:hypothetical protein [Vibrio penaeicida]RTZ23012.1 hypothetical protein EKN09_11050 [Vibrio penaeicida]GLQ71058.1 hypothetical protein GCM10007932_04180 [Vibrio penaeicida]